MLFKGTTTYWIIDDTIKINFDYMLKDIHNSNKKEYLIKLYDSVFKFINRLRWNFFFFNKHDECNTLNYDDNKENIFKRSRSAPTCDELKSFEKDLFNKVKNIKFNKFISSFQKFKYDLIK